MKLKIKIPKRLLVFSVCMISFLLLSQVSVIAQEGTGKEEIKTKPTKAKPVKNTFQSIWIIDNQTVMVPVKGTFEFDIQHRFGTVQKGYKDFWGLFAPSNIRLGIGYTPINKLFVGLGITKDKMLWDGSIKYAIMQQTKGKFPLSITYYGNMAYESRKDADGSLYKYSSQRLSFFNQLIIARKVTDKFSVQVAPSVSHQNAVKGYYTKNDSTGQEIFKEMKFDHFAIAFSGRYKLTNTLAFMVNYDQPITKHATRNPHPNFSFGFEVNTSSHAFQVFAGNYYTLNPQQNNLYNEYNPFGYTNNGTKVKGGQFVIGFNITRLWNF